MTGIERYWKEHREARMAEFQHRMKALREEFSDLDLFYGGPVIEPDDIIEVPGKIFRSRRWSWK